VGCRDHLWSRDSRISLSAVKRCPVLAFRLLPEPGGEVAWCVVSAAAYTTGLYRLTAIDGAGSHFLRAGIALLTVWFSVKANIHDAQAQLVMTGLVLHAGADFAQQRWRRGAFLAVLSTAMKTVSLPFTLVAFVIFPKARLPMLVAALAALALPFVHGNPSFVAHEYHEALVKLVVAAAPAQGEWPWIADIGTFLRQIGIALDIRGQTAIRAVAAILVLAACWLDRSSSLDRRVMTLLTLTLTFATVFNPRAESVSYAALTSIPALWAARELVEDWQRPFGYVSLLAGIALGVPWGVSIDPWLKPLIGLGCSILAMLGVWQSARTAWKPQHPI
jgi:alpha-1,2-mannosyltransferase